MSFEIPKAHVQQYSANIEHLSQQQGSRARSTVMVMTGIVGTRANFDQVGPTVAVKRTARHGDSPLISTPHSRRILDIVEYEWGDLVDNDDQIKTLYDPTNEYTRAGINAHGRAMDSEIITAFTATATIGGADGLSTTTEAFAGTDVTEGGDGVSLIDMITARGALRSAEHIQGNEALTCLCSSAFIDDLLVLSEVQSIDQNTFRALTMGEVTSFMGFNFVQTELVGGIGTASEKAYIYPRKAIKLGIGADIITHVDRRADKSYAWYPYARMSIGATRTQASIVSTITHDGSDAPGG